MPRAISAIRPPLSAPLRMTPSVAGYGHTSTANATTPMGMTHASTRRTVASGTSRIASAFTPVACARVGAIPPGTPSGPQRMPRRWRGRGGSGGGRGGSCGGPRDDGRHDGGEIATSVLLEEVAAADDGRVGLAGRTGDRG